MLSQPPNDGRLAARIRNENATGRPIVFIHGAGGRKEIWALVARRLAARLPARPLVTVDLPGHGDSPPPAAERIDDYAQAVSTFLERHGWPAIDLVGHSMGGAVAQRLAIAEPARVTRLALLATGARMPVAPVLFDLLPDNLPAVVEAYKSFGFGPDTPPLLLNQTMEPFAQMDGAVVRGDFVACREWQAGDRLGGITAATLILVGELDQLTPLKRARELAAGIPGARLEILPHAGHMLPVEKAEDVSGLLAAHLGAEP